MDKTGKNRKENPEVTTIALRRLTEGGGGGGGGGGVESRAVYPWISRRPTLALTEGGGGGSGVVVLSRGGGGGGPYRRYRTDWAAFFEGMR